MAIKSIPSVGEAFLGSDPFVPKILRVTLGSSGYSGANDVDIATTEAGAVLVTFQDSGLIVTDLAVRIVEVFSTNIIQIGPDSDIALWDFNDTDSGLFTSGTVSDLLNLRNELSTGDWGALTPSDFGVKSSSLFPGTSAATIKYSFSASGTLGTEGHLELYVYYHEIP